MGGWGGVFDRWEWKGGSIVGEVQDLGFLDGEGIFLPSSELPYFLGHFWGPSSSPPPLFLSSYVLPPPLPEDIAWGFPGAEEEFRFRSIWNFPPWPTLYPFLSKQLSLVLVLERER
ncbi:hypothetical protein AVEN_31606-1 [Araneus ventricosus]|uniref:Uncharacterized protein n=1 Tax=Araneus ventricosus TaxID=182803 RepID=A0A4Y2SV52_ARAVE|nr:hypothetical protein AVEN_31606-1 [Araneus ventricosus]